jgi:EAL domain-containing protein (putative c-di-GMP-specific phosphodiesterase class I)
MTARTCRLDSSGDGSPAPAGLRAEHLLAATLKPDTSDAAIVESTISLCNLLGLAVIAEGIEERATIDWLRRMGCDEGQGFYFGRPIPVAEFERTFLSNGDLRHPRADEATIIAAA